MEDETTKEENQPSTSKKETQRTTSGTDLYDDRGRDDQRSNSETSVSRSYSARSRLEMADARPEIPKQPLGKREPKQPERREKKRGRKPGRIEKRPQRSYTRRQVRKAPKRKPRPREDKKGRDGSISTIFTRLSSGSDSRILGCIHCGHRCCRRRAKRFVARFEYRRCQARRLARPKLRRKKIVRIKRPKRKPATKDILPQFSEGMSLRGSKQIQEGSRSKMFSPLFVKTNSAPEESVISPPPQTYSQVTPQMIHESLRILTLWQEDVATIFVLDHLRRNYPVNPNEIELLKELKEKLRIAAIVGIVVQTRDPPDHWCLTCKLQKRKLATNHVTLFWQAYTDTLKPVTKKPVETPQDEKIERETNTLKSGLVDDLI